MNRKGIVFQTKPRILAGAAAVGELEAEGPLKTYFDVVSSDSKFGMKTWEKAEAEMVRACSVTALKKAKKTSEDIDLSFSGDLTNQCAASTFGLKEHKIPSIGLYGACSTFVLAIGMAGCAMEAGLAKTSMTVSSSHFCSAERQYRFPLEYGCQRTPAAQTTVTGAGCLILESSEQSEDQTLPYLSEFFPGVICDLGVHDANNMGAAMAPACADTLLKYFMSTKQSPDNFDCIITGDLGAEGSRLFQELCLARGIDVSTNHKDCGKMIFDAQKQEVGAGGSGCGCSASVFSGYYLKQFYDEKISDVLFLGTGALLSGTTVLQNETIPSITHLVRIKKEKV